MWQKGCEGSRSPSLLVTENLIRSVHESRGEKSLIKESDVEIAKIKQSVSYADLVFLKNSKPVIPNNLDQSQININTSMNVESPNIQQSAVNINLWSWEPYQPSNNKYIVDIIFNKAIKRRCWRGLSWWISTTIRTYSGLILISSSFCLSSYLVWLGSSIRMWTSPWSLITYLDWCCFFPVSSMCTIWLLSTWLMELILSVRRLSSFIILLH